MCRRYKECYLAGAGVLQVINCILLVCVCVLFSILPSPKFESDEDGGHVDVTSNIPSPTFESKEKSSGSDGRNNIPSTTVESEKSTSGADGGIPNANIHVPPATVVETNEDIGSVYSGMYADDELGENDDSIVQEDNFATCLE